MKVFKFGGASVKNADAVRNVGEILSRYKGEKLVVVISAMGKVTNALEDLHRARFHKKDSTEILNSLKEFHFTIAQDLFGSSEADELDSFFKYFEEMEERLGMPCTQDEDMEYDQVVSYGELFSTAMVYRYLQKQGFSIGFADARMIVRTDNRHRDARVDWAKSGLGISQVQQQLERHDIIIVQGFIGSAANNTTTTLGREGSDFTAAIMAYLLDAESVTIWKDVPGMLNADPRHFNDTVKLDKISFREAIELAYYGASVIHPKTVKPLQNKNIPLYIKSFIDPEAAGSVIQESTANDHLIPSIIYKNNQVLISITPRDFSFVVEDNLKEIFDLLSQIGIRIHMMENSALNFSVCMDKDDYKQSKLFDALKQRYSIKYNEGIELLTVRHYDDALVSKLVAQREVLLEQRNRQTVRMVTRQKA